MCIKPPSEWRNSEGVNMLLWIISQIVLWKLNKNKSNTKSYIGLCNFKDEDYIDNDTYTKSQYVRWSLGFIEINPKWAVPNNDGMPDRVRPSELDFDSQMKSINKLLFDTNKKPSKCK